MADTEHALAHRYDKASGGWGDKMRALGYHDAYLGFLASALPRPEPGEDVLDVGCGSGAFAEAWAAIHGDIACIGLLDPSARMLDRAAAALDRRGVRHRAIRQTLEDFAGRPAYDHIFAAHVIEHCADPADALARMRALAAPGGRLWLVASRPHWCNAIIWLQWRHRTFQDGEVAALLQGAGWLLEDIYSFPSGPPSRTSRGYRARAV
jgi:ubiquinone/menaquinone biosynthesis C-methylase UbiE